MNYIIMDLEWNKPTVPKKTVRGLYGEIIQVGLIKVNENLEELDTFNEIIKPVYYKKINNDIKELTGITQRDLDNAKLQFNDCIEKFKNFVDSDSILITWSFTDMEMLYNNLEMLGLETSWVPSSYNAQYMFDDQVTNEGRDFALNYALYKFNEKPDNSHDALDDARSTLKVMRHLDIKSCLTDEYKY